MTVENILEKLKDLLKIPSVVRFEQAMLDYLEGFCLKLEDYEVTQTDRLLVVKKKSTGSERIISVHIDRHGIVKNNSGELVYAAFEAEKYYEDNIEATEYVFERVASRYIGEEFYAYNPVTGAKLSRGKVIGANYDFENKCVKFQMKNLGNIANGTPLALVSKLLYHDDYFYSQIDNSISVAVAMQLLEEKFDGTIIFSTEEEIGMSWKHIATYLEEQKIETQELIVIDTSPYKYIHSIDEGLVVLRNKDEDGIFNKELVNEIRIICENDKIPFEFKDEIIEKMNIMLEKQGEDPKKFGHTELGRLVENTQGKINGVTIQLPSINYHTNKELSSMKALTNYYKLLKELLL